MIINTAEAHEVYVLTPNEVTAAKEAPRLPFGPVLAIHQAQFIFYTVPALALVIVVFWVSIQNWFRHHLGYRLEKLRPLAPRLTQITVGVALLASAYYDSAFGPEISLPLFFGHWAVLAQAVMALAGMSLLFGVFPEIGALLGVLLYLIIGWEIGPYIIMYGVYFGDLLIILLFAADYRLWGHFLHRVLIIKHLVHYRFLLLRILFGISLIAAAIYAKFIYNMLAFETITKFNLTEHLPFDPDFLLLGALCIELLIGLFYLIGFEVRAVSIFFLFFLITSVLFFKESVWPHLVLFGTALAMFCHGEDKYTLGYWLRRKLNKL